MTVNLWRVWLRKWEKEFKIATYIDSSWLVKHTILHTQSSMAKCNHHNCLLLCQRKVNWVVLLILLRAQAIYFLGRDTVNIVVSKPSIHLCHNAFQCQKTQKKKHRDEHWVHFTLFVEALLAFGPFKHLRLLQTCSKCRNSQLINSSHVDRFSQWSTINDEWISCSCKGGGFKHIRKYH